MTIKHKRGSKISGLGQIEVSETVNKGKAIKFVNGKIKEITGNSGELIIGVSYQRNTDGNASGTSTVEYFPARNNIFEVDCTLASSTTSGAGASDGSTMVTSLTAASTNAYKGASVVIPSFSQVKVISSSTSAGVFYFADKFKGQVGNSTAFKYFKLPVGTTTADMSDSSSLSPTSSSGKVTLLGIDIEPSSGACKVEVKFNES